MIEYNTPLALIKEKCDEYNIKYIIISEYNRESDYYSFPNDDKLSFKKIVNNIDKINLEINTQLLKVCNDLDLGVKLDYEV